MKALCTSFIFLLFCFVAYAQGETNNWVFGENAGVSWNTGVPVAFSGSVMVQQEGVCCISNSAGQLLFYSDGVKVWNRLNQQMPNGFGLMGNNTTTQSGIIVPWPGDTSRYYLFTVDALTGANGIRYSVVDMTLHGGLGDVVTATKNTLLYTPTCEKVTAVGHANGTDIWIASHQWDTDSFYVHLVTSGGINPPVISEVGTRHIGNTGNSGGYMKFSPDARKLTLTMANSATVEFFDFNNSTGQVSNPIYDNYGAGNGAYGVEFSPSSRYVYISQMGGTSPQIFQYDFQAGSTAAILASKYLVATGDFAGNWIFELQLAVDKKIYVCKYLAAELAVINNPDSGGAACNYQSTAVSLTNGALCRLGLPNFVQSFFKPTCSILNVSISSSRDSICESDTVQICATPAFSSYMWNNGAATSCIGASDAGTFYVTVTDNNGCSAESNHLAITVHPPPIDSITVAKPTFCSGDSARVCASPGFASYHWNMGQTDSCIQAKLAGNYYVTVTDNSGCTAESNRLAISVYPQPLVAISVNGDTLKSYDAVAYQWYLNGVEVAGATSNVYIANQGGSYTVAITDSNGCSATSNPTFITGIENVSEEDVVSVYQLAVDRWQLTVGDNYIGGIAEVYDANGKLVFKSAIRNSQSEIAAGAARGVYLLRISSGKSSVVRKLVRF